MLTAEIIKNSSPQPYHTRPAQQLDDVWVSSRSQWKSTRWDLDTAGLGDRGYVSLRWDIKLADGRSLLEPEFKDALDWLRRFVWTLYASPGRKAAPVKTTSTGYLNSSLSIFVPWLIEHGVFWPHELTRQVIESYLEDLPALIVERRARAGIPGTEISKSVAFYGVFIVFRLWQQREVLEKAGIRPMPEHPSANLRSANSIARQIGVQELGWIQPLPDEVAIPLLNRAAWFLGTPADDLLSLRDRMEEAYRAAPYPKIAEIHQRKESYKWQFAKVAAEPAPWHPVLTTFKSRGPQRVLQLMKHLQAAALISLQAFTGMRISELCGLPQGSDPETGLPLCVEKRTSSSGLNEVFILKTELSKTEEVPREVSWYLGLRPLGSDELPLPVRALIILDRISQPYRHLIGSTRLSISLRASRGLPKTSKGAAILTRDAIAKMYKEFVAEWVDLSTLPDESAHRTSEEDLVAWRESKGRVLTSHQLRKTFALYVLSVEPRLLPAVRRQFQHVSVAMTEGGYWGRNPVQIETIDSVSSQQTALLMYELATGRTKVAGKGGARFGLGMDELKQQIVGMNVEQGWREAVKWTRSKDVESVIAQHGACAPLRTSEMECWKKVGARPLGHRKPNYDSRDPGMCAGCAAFWMDARHVPYWEGRYIQNEVAFCIGTRSGPDASFRRIRERARQARNLLRHLGIDLSSAENEVSRQVKEYDDRKKLSSSTKTDG